MSVRCGKTGRGIPYPSLPGYEVIPAWSRGRQPWNKLSPMKIGPISWQEPQLFYDPSTETITVGPVTSAVSTCKLFENWWQGGKLYLKDLKDPSAAVTLANLKYDPQQEINFNKDNLVPYDFWHRRLYLWQSDKPKRRPLPKAKYGVPISSYYLGQIMDYITSRKIVYCPTYANLVEQSPQYQLLKEKFAKGENLLIIGPDGLSNPETELTKETLLKLVNDPQIIFGHELVLCSLLLGYKVWEM